MTRAASFPRSDGTVVRKHGERDHADGLREGAGGGGAESELQQPRQSRGVPADGKRAPLLQRASHRLSLTRRVVFKGIPGRSQGQAAGPAAEATSASSPPAAPTGGVAAPASTSPSAGAEGGRWWVGLCWSRLEAL